MKEHTERHFKLPRIGGREVTIAKDRYFNKIMVHKNYGSPGWDLQTDGRVFLDIPLARRLANWLNAFADNNVEGCRNIADSKRRAAKSEAPGRE